MFASEQDGERPLPGSTLRAVEDLGAPASYLTLGEGAEAYASDGKLLGEVQHVLAAPDQDIFDGIVIDVSWLPGGLRFADASQVSEIYERGVVLSVDSRQAEHLPEPSENPGELEVTGVESVDRSELSEKLRRAWEVLSGKGP
jgi:hypothetical protein